MGLAGLLVEQRGFGPSAISGEAGQLCRVVGAEAAKRSRAQVRTISLTSAHSLAPLLGPMCMETWASVNPVPPRRREEGVLARIDHADPARSAEQAADAAAYAAGVQLSERLSIVEM